MGGLPPAQIDRHPLRAEAVEAAIRVTREEGRVEARRSGRRGRAREG
jgi:hypothetical protein